MSPGAHNPGDFYFLAIWVKTLYTINISKGDNNEKTFISCISVVLGVAG